METEFMRILLCGDKDSVKDLKEHLVNLAERVKRVVGVVIKDGFNNLLKALIEVPNTDRKVRHEKRECRNTVSAARAKAITFMDDAYRFFQYGDIDNTSQQAIKEAYKNGDTKRIQTFAEQIKMYLHKCDESYDEFLTAYSEAKVMCGKLAKECGVKKDSARKNKHYKYVGAATALAIAVAPFTFNFGGFILMGLAGSKAAITCISGVASLTALAAAVKDEKMEDAFKKICESMDSAIDDLAEINSSLRYVMDKLKGTSFNLEKTLNHVDEKQVYEDFCRVFDILITGIKSGHKTFDEHSSAVHSRTLAALAVFMCQLHIIISTSICFG